MSTHPVSRRLLHTLWNVPSSALDSGVTRLGVCGDADTLQLIRRGIVWKVERDEMAAWENFFLILLRCLKEELIATSESGHSLVIYVCPKFGHDCLYWCVKVLLPTDMHTTANSILAWNFLSCPPPSRPTLQSQIFLTPGHLSRAVFHKGHREMKHIFPFPHPPILTRLVWDGVQESALFVSSRWFWHQSTWVCTPTPRRLECCFYLKGGIWTQRAPRDF